jgi:hypothetical protein
MTPERAQYYTTRRLSWIKKRARRYQTGYHVPRRLAIFDAWLDFILLMGNNQ